MSEHTGRCRCNGVVAQVSGDPNFSVYCHCDDCRRATGAPLLASVAFPKENVVWLNEETLAQFQNGSATRLFCKRCGTPVAQLHESANDRVFFNTAFMDEPNRFPPTAHTFAGEQLSWMELGDALPRHETTILIKTGAGA